MNTLHGPLGAVTATLATLALAGLSFCQSAQTSVVQRSATAPLEPLTTPLVIAHRG